ncbi:MAG: right-handed parallel beta-helix repeat-containing protein, partial [Candidatus Altiarchaeota archaeon]|nr:right-handed parallel beta-helix repeat-containing protein [Candidatus Altiarchaeota archaeon]
MNNNGKSARVLFYKIAFGILILLFLMDNASAGCVGFRISSCASISNQHQCEKSSEQVGSNWYPCFWTGTYCQLPAGSCSTVLSCPNSDPCSVDGQITWDGSGVSGDPFQIDNCTELEDIGYELSSNFVLTDDIDCDVYPFNQGAGFVPIGTSSDMFRGVLDGDFHSINGFSLSVSATPDISLFAYTYAATIKNLHLSYTISGGDYSGGLISHASDSQVINVSVNGTLWSSDYAGGLIGHMNGGTVDSCSANVVLGLGENEGYQGGLIGKIEAATVTNSYSNGSISCGQPYCGGFAGAISAGSTVDDSYSLMAVSASSGPCGGFAGLSDAEMENIFYAGNVGSSSCGAIAGNTDSLSNIISAYWYTQTANVDCIKNEMGTNICTEVTDIDYFKDNVYPTNPPMSSWGFYGIWNELEGGFPRLAWEGVGGRVYNTELTDCEILDGEGLTYSLQNHITSAPSTCFRIIVDNVVLDLGGYNISGDNTGSDVGLYISGHDFITVKNGVISDFGDAGGGSGLYLSNVNWANFTNLTLFGNRKGIYALNSDSNLFHSNTLHDNTYGIYLSSSDNNSITSNNIEDDYSIWMEDESLINTVCYNTINAPVNYGVSIFTSSDNLICSNNILDSGNRGIGVFGLSFDNVFLNNNISDSNDLAIHDATTSPTPNHLIYNNSFGSIRWTYTSFLDDLSVSGDLTFPGSVAISDNFAYFNFSAISASLMNSSANVTLYGMGSHSFTTPRIFRDGVLCSTCHNFTSLNANVVVFNVSSWSNYTLMDYAGSPTPTTAAPTTAAPTTAAPTTAAPTTAAPTTAAPTTAA